MHKDDFKIIAPLWKHYLDKMLDMPEEKKNRWKRFPMQMDWSACCRDLPYALEIHRARRRLERSRYAEIQSQNAIRAEHAIAHGGKEEMGFGVLQRSFIA